MKLLDQVRQMLRVRHYSYRTEQCYVCWIMHYLRFSKATAPGGRGLPVPSGQPAGQAMW
jgi:hypothetical protein